MEQAGSPLEEPRELRDLFGRTIEEAVKYRRQLDNLPDAPDNIQAQAHEFDDQLERIPFIDLRAATVLFAGLATDVDHEVRSPAAIRIGFLYQADKVAGTRLFVTCFYDIDLYVREDALEGVKMGFDHGRISPEEAAALFDAYKIAQQRIEQHKKPPLGRGDVEEFDDWRH